MAKKSFGVGLAALCSALLATPAWAEAQAAAPAESAAASARTKVVHAGRMLDVRTGKVQQNVYIGIDGGKISSISTTPPPEGTEVIDLSDSMVMPGLISAHVHLLVPWPDYSTATLLNASTAQQVLWGVRNARTYLDKGFTTVRNACEFGAGGDAYAQLTLRDAIARGELDGPRVISAGQCVSVTGGHGDGHRQPVEHGVRKGPNVADTADEIEAVVRRDVKYGADWIKLMATGGAVDPISDYSVQELSDAQLVRAVETAHRAGKKVMAHAEGTAGILAAVRAGVDSLEHGTIMDEESAKIMAAKGIWLVPTLACFQRTDLNAANDMDPESVRKTLELLREQQPSFDRARRHKIRIVFGDDDASGLVSEEFASLVKAGLSPIEAIQTATVNAAEMLEVPAGVIEVGRDADLIAIQGDPLQDITALYSVGFVMRGGKVFKAAEAQ